MPDVVSPIALRKEESVAYLQRTFDQLRQTLEPLSADAAWVCELARRTATGGKHMRSLLVHVGADRPATTTPTADIAVGAAFDLLHAAFLVLDDVIDADELRRGEPTVHAAAQARAEQHHGLDTPAEAAHYGTSVAILAGTSSLNQAYRIITDCGAPPETTVQLLRALQDATADSMVGEFMDIHHSLPNVSAPDSLINLASRLKTSSYSFESPLIAGAILAGRGNHIAALRQLGRSIGSAYQLADDIQSIFAPSSSTGKNPAGDLTHNRATPLMSRARTTSTWAELSDAIGSNNPENLTQVRQLLRKSGAVDWAQHTARTHLEHANRIVTTTPLCSPDAQQVMLGIIDYVNNSVDVGSPDAA